MFNTPLFQYKNISVKLEYKNPAGSIKDRPALMICKEAFLRGYREIVEVTSGNMGIALGFYAKKFGLKVSIFMPKSYSVERQRLLRLYGADLILTEGGISDAIKEAQEYSKKEGVYFVRQFENPLNPASQEITALEILTQTSLPDYFVCGVGSGGTLSGMARVLKPLGVKIVAVESKNSPVIYNKIYNKNLPVKPHKIQGIGAGFIPKTVDVSLIDEVVLIDDEEALLFTKSNNTGINGGISTAANILASERFEGRVLSVAPDSVERYLSIL